MYKIRVVFIIFTYFYLKFLFFFFNLVTLTFPFGNKLRKIIPAIVFYLYTFEIAN